MIQTCSRCGTRWNVRDRRRGLCPRCGGQLLAPVSAQPAGQAPGPRPPGYRWIAVRPGAAPKARGARQDLGPTPQYRYTPRWGLNQEFTEESVEQDTVRTGPSSAMVNTTVTVALWALAVAALLHVARYVLLLINRTVLLNRWVAAAGTWLGVAAGVVAFFSVVAVALVLINWLIARRTQAYERSGHTDPRPRWWLRVASLVPVLNLFWAPVFVLELARLEDRLSRLRRPIVTWWAVWVVATLLALWSVGTSFTADPQGIADNTVSTIIAYLAGLAAVLYVHKVYVGFEGSAAAAPGRRWVVTESAAPVEDNAEEPAA